MIRVEFRKGTMKVFHVDESGKRTEIKNAGTKLKDARKRLKELGLKEKP